MQSHQPSSAGLRAAGASLTRTHLPILALIAASLLVLDGCQAVGAIFKVGALFGALIIITIVAVIGGMAALVIKRR